MSGERQVPFFCPYCGEEDLVPAEASPGRWVCRSCARRFALHSLAIADQETPS
jgi:ribosomal protein L37AE/L43A